MIPWTVAYQAPLSMEFSRQGYWSGLPFPAPGHFPDPGIESGSPALQADSLSSEPPGSPINHLSPGFLENMMLYRLRRKVSGIVLHALQWYTVML